MAKQTVYTIVRNDLKLNDIVAQTGHSCLLAGAAYSPRKDCCHIVLQVKDEKELITIYSALLDKGIQCEGFYEPENAQGEELGWTSLTTAPLSYTEKQILRGLLLWKPKTGVDNIIGLWSNICTRLRDRYGK